LEDLAKNSGYLVVHASVFEVKDGQVGTETCQDLLKIDWVRDVGAEEQGTVKGYLGMRAVN
jgi:hypothetical protein